MAALTRVRGSLPTSERERQELATITGALDLMMTGDRPSEWHLQFDRGTLGMYRGMAREARATVFMDEATLYRLLAGELDWTTGYLTGQVRVRGASDFGLVLGGVLGGIADALSTNPTVGRVIAGLLLVTSDDADVDADDAVTNEPRPGARGGRS